ncbi:MAG: thiamine-phosphate pyrophosphorylase [Bacteroidetes bacterium]|nr:MAG: thiamine-phosphate pyrophosphorylase [Bacteroidota bacterium]
MKLIVISSSKTIEKEHEIITQLFEHGLNTFHLRKPDMTTKEMRQMIEKIPAHFHDRIVIHSHHNLAGSLKLRGIHLTRAHRRRKFSTWFRLRMLHLRRSSFTQSTSLSKLAHVYEDEGKFSYVFLSPIFESLSGGFHAGYNQHSLRTAIEKNPHVKIVARGGISLEHIANIRDLGFHGMAFHSFLWRAGDPLANFISVLDKCAELGIKAE